VTRASDWQRSPLGAVLKAQYGKSLPAAKRTGGDVPVYGSNGIVGWHDEALTVGPTIVIGRKGSSGAVNFSPVPCWPIDTTFFVDDPGPFDLEFLDYLLRSLRLTELDRSTAIPGLNRDQLYELQVPVPPVHDQQALAMLLHSFEGHRRSSADHVADATHAAERFCRALLGAAGSGRLTERWRSARGLRDHGDLPHGWARETIQSLAADVPRAIQSGPFGSSLLHSEFQATGRLVIGIDNVLDGHFVAGSKHRISNAKFEELRRYEARPLDVLITVMATVGRVCVVPPDIEPAIITKHVYRITVDKTRIDPYFLMHALRGHQRVREQIQTQTRGQTRPGINGQIVKGLLVALPPLDEQQEIVRRVDQLLELADQLQKRIADARRRVDRSSQAVLAKAFRGELGDTREAAPRGAAEPV
jgi:type I restriction enzyme S subunit